MYLFNNDYIIFLKFIENHTYVVHIKILFYLFDNF